MIETIILCTIFGVFIFASFIVGLSFGVKLRNNEKIEIPNLNPIKAVKKAVKENKQEQYNRKEQEIYETNLYNIDNYDGTGLGQKNFPS